MLPCVHFWEDGTTVQGHVHFSWGKVSSAHVAKSCLIGCSPANGHCHRI